MREDELLSLVEKTSVLMERYQLNTDKTTHNNAQITQNLQQIVQNLRSLQGDIPQQVKNGAYNAIKEGMEKSVYESTEVLQNTTAQLKFEAHHLKEDRDKVYKMAKWLSYKTLGLVYGSALLVWFASAFFAWKNVQSGQQSIKKAEWISSINTAVDNGKLIACQDGVVCANISGKLVRLDK